MLLLMPRMSNIVQHLLYNKESVSMCLSRPHCSLMLCWVDASVCTICTISAAHAMMFSFAQNAAVAIAAPEVSRTMSCLVGCCSSCRPRASLTDVVLWQITIVRYFRTACSAIIGFCRQVSSKHSEYLKPRLVELWS